ncbi:hypothetical protein AB0G74_28425 [Streptomyces sp. NPDC020875]|uniref:hypothetical protein n=1 Tax=Streptomyces sp. NPDC020875 TaxID=3154898 RepID=UPI0033EAF096
MTADSLDLDACAALARRLRKEGIENMMHIEPLNPEDYRDGDNVQPLLAALKVDLFIMSARPWHIRVEHTLGQILDTLEGQVNVWKTSTIPGYPPQWLIDSTRQSGIETLDRHHATLMALLDNHPDA